jgi:hypothetical protein
MDKVNVKHFAVGNTYLYIIDDQDRIWQKAINGGTEWHTTGTLPDEPAPDVTHINLDLTDAKRPLNIQDVAE